ncbi:MAG: L,D-transpeptidase family protein [Desulfobacula sp.]|uniref:L,D-transpeptidase family protein n=1 Tax=Desulfobacula sp. TaxID=2593537 RepID=UPI001D8D35BD|nr:L,D-transpeptidase family protein [Desulfobacula sp.]MBT3487472.1 L,D-transpeptidase family protein [Desulfobacula sp.]MBT3806247.1 L,D-transpeptidase family protein [Desulfobacula sp.]MBT4025284.1 L,D-transpeptidase family protein [Desulfobacula sp.]MBT4199387.1 L,D-transpeptidase family protein [Desulfobacula sp.]
MKIFVILFSIVFGLTLPLFAENEDIRKIIENPSLYNGIENIFCVETLTSIYEENSFQPFWTDTSIAATFIDTLRAAKYEGLEPNDYHYDFLVKKIPNSSAESKSLRDVLLTDAFLLYSNHLLSGKLKPEDLHPEWNLQRRKEDIIALFKRSVNSENLFSNLEKIKPKQPGYIELKKKLKYYYDLTEEIKYIVSKGSILKPKTTDKRIPEIRNNLEIIEMTRLTVPEDKTLYDDDLFVLIKQFQGRHGLNSDGWIGDNTIKMLNMSISDRINVIKVNLERLKWMPDDYGETYILVNLSDYMLSLYKGNRLAAQHKVIIGKSYRKTPIFSDKMTYLVFNPTWTVPPTILKNDIIPAVRKDKDYLKKKNIRIFKVNTLNAGEVASEDLDWENLSGKNFPYTLVQIPGPSNSLGQIKFMFPNKYNIYIHDTPDKQLFQKEEKNFSSGCIRVEGPVKLAEIILKDLPEWNREKIDSIIATNKETTIRLPKPIAVHILYWTSWVDDNGVIQFRKDIYSRDVAVLEGLKKRLY